MSASKYFVWSGSRWRELDTEKGSVAGWARRPRFVFVRRGKLRVAARRRVLSALQALAARGPSAAGLGPRLSVRSKEPASRSPSELKRIREPPACKRQHCCMHVNGYSNIQTCSHTTDPAPSTTAAPRHRDIAIQHSATADAAVQYTPVEHGLTISLTNNTSTVKQNIQSNNVKKIRAPPLDTLLKESPRKRKRESLSDNGNFQRPENAEIDKVKSKKYVSKRTEEETSEASQDEICKELTISESDISALRSYVARTREDALERFDADDGYKRALFYAINPLVDVERCARTERALKERHDLVLPHFAARLGLTPRGSVEASPSQRRRIRKSDVRYRERSSSRDTDKENKLSKKSSIKHDGKNGSARKSSNKSGKKPNLSGNKSTTDESESDQESNAFKKSNKHSLRKSTGMNTDKNTTSKKIQSLPQRKVKNTAKDSGSESESDNFQKYSKQKLRQTNTSKKKTAKQNDSSTDNSSDDESESNKNRRSSLRKPTTAQIPQINIDSSSDNSKSDTDTSTSLVGKTLRTLDKYKSKTFKKKTRQTKGSNSDEESENKTKRKTKERNKGRQTKLTDSSGSDDSKAIKQSTDESDSSDKFQKKQNRSIQPGTPSKRTNDVALKKPIDNKRQSLRKSTVIQSEAEKSGTNKQNTENNRKAVEENSDCDVDEKLKEKNTSNKKTAKQNDSSTDNSSDDESESNKNRRSSLRKSTTAQIPQINIDSSSDNSKSDTDTSTSFIDKSLRTLDKYKSKTFKKKTRPTKGSNSDEESENKTKRKTKERNKGRQTKLTASSDSDDSKANKQSTDESDSSDEFQKKQNRSIQPGTPSKRPNDVALKKPTENKRQSLRKSTVIQSEAEKSGTNKQNTETNRKAVKENADSDVDSKKNKKNKKESTKTPSNDYESNDNSNVNKKATENNHKTAKDKKLNKTLSDDSESEEQRNVNKNTTEKNRNSAKDNKTNFNSDVQRDKNKRNDNISKKSIKNRANDSESDKEPANNKTEEHKRNFYTKVAKKIIEKLSKNSKNSRESESESDDQNNDNNKTAKNNHQISKENKSNFAKEQENNKNKKYEKLSKKTVKETQNDSDSDDDEPAYKKTRKNINIKSSKETEKSDSDSIFNESKQSNKNITKQTNTNKNNNTAKENKRKPDKYKNIQTNIGNNQSDSGSITFEKKSGLSAGSSDKTTRNTATSPKKTATGSKTKSGSEKSYVFKPTSSSTIQTSSSTEGRQSKSKNRGPKASGSLGIHTISKRASGRGVKEYSNLEDHAIVAWVSSGARARKVNGNVLWRELQENYSKLTGTSRSWHSIRNRYLRYILPSLGALRLPPADVSRLRAAAATGEIKGKRLGLDSRRNSIFKEAEVRGASSRRPRLEIQREEDTKKKEESEGDSAKEDAKSSSKRQSLRSYFVAPRPYNDKRQSSSAVNSPATPSKKRKRDDSGNERDASAHKRDDSRKSRDPSERERDESENRRSSLRNNRDSRKEESDSSKRDESRKRDSLRNGRDHSKSRRGDRRKEDEESDQEAAPTRSRRSLTQASQPVPSTSNSKTRKLFNPKLVM